MAVTLSLAAIAVFAVAAVTDARHRRISNRLSAGLVLIGVARIAMALAAGASSGAAATDVAAALAVFFVGAAAFRFGLLGGGDVKLLAAGALWVGAATAGAFLLTTALAGGVLAVSFVGWQLALPGGRTARAPALPYGIAIAAGGILTTLSALLS